MQLQRIVIGVMCSVSLVAIATVEAKQALIEKEGYVIVEAEDIDHDQVWRLTTNPSGYTGDGFLSYQGAKRGSGDFDCTGDQQPPVDERLIFRVIVSNPGPYVINA
jgi:hypothetical protein